MKILHAAPRLYAMDTFFFNSLGSYPWNARCEMLSQLGFDGTYLTLWSEDAWADLDEVRHTRERFGIEVAAVYWTLDLDDRGLGNSTFVDVLRDEIRVAQGTRFEIAIVGADAFDTQDARLQHWLGQISQAARERNLQIALYPHAGFWLETLAQTTQIIGAFPDANLQSVFCGYHWFAKEAERGPKYLQQVLAEAAPFLGAANVCGSTARTENQRRSCSIELIGRGELDNFALLSMLRNVGFSGWLGLQGFGLGGDVYVNLRESIANLRDVLLRADAHPEWAQLRAE